MKKLLLFGFAVMLMAASVGAITYNGAPQLINYQGKLTDGAGNPVADGAHAVEFRIWDDTLLTGGLHLIWDSGPVSVTTDKGLFTIKLGTPPQPTLGLNSVYDTSIFLGITVGADPEIAPRSRLVSVPFALSAQYARSASTAGTAYYLDPTSMPAAGTITLNLASTNAASPTAVGQFTVTAPGAGYFVMNASGMMYIDADANSTSAVTEYYAMGLCSSPGSLSTCGGTYYYHYQQDADNTDVLTVTPTFSLNETFVVGAAGTYTFYINVASLSPYTTFPWGPCNVNVLFTPSTLTITSPTPANPDQKPQKQE